MTNKMNANDVREYLDHNLPREPGTKIEYGHPSPRFWEERQKDFPELLEPLNEDRQLTLYLHIPFCPPTTPTACGFCLFAREDITSYKIVEAYLQDMHQELERYAELLGRRRLRAVYIGGGTPNILKVPEIRRLFSKLHEYFEIPSSAEITFEGTPNLFTRDRLEALAEVGTNRISIGMQVMKPHLIRHSGRKWQRPEQIKHAAEFCSNHGIRCNVDLITGWFEQTPQDVLDDIDLLTEWGVTEIVNHLITLQGNSAFAARRDELPDVEVTCKSFLTARDRMLELGYRADSYTDYCRSELPVVQYLELYRDILKNDRVGVGYGANSLLAGTLTKPGLTYMNVVGISPYHQRVAAGKSCIGTMFQYTREDIQLLYVLKGLEGYPYLKAADYKETFGSDLNQDFEPWWEELERRHWLVWEGDDPKLVGEGIFYTSSVQRCLSEPRNKVMRAHRQTMAAA